MTEGRRIFLIYDADATIRGELSYFVGHALGKLNCSLCDISHGPLVQKKAWKKWRREMAGRGHDLRPIHRNEMSEPLREFVAGRLACVVEERSGTYHMLLSPAELARCNGRVDALAAMLDTALSEEQRD